MEIVVDENVDSIFKFVDKKLKANPTIPVIRAVRFHYLYRTQPLVDIILYLHERNKVIKFDKCVMDPQTLNVFNKLYVDGIRNYEFVGCKIVSHYYYDLEEFQIIDTFLQNFNIKSHDEFVIDFENYPDNRDHVPMCIKYSHLVCFSINLAFRSDIPYDTYNLLFNNQHVHWHSITFYFKKIYDGDDDEDQFRPLKCTTDKLSIVFIPDYLQKDSFLNIKSLFSRLKDLTLNGGKISCEYFNLLSNLVSSSSRSLDSIHWSHYTSDCTCSGICQATFFNKAKTSLAICPSLYDYDDLQIQYSLKKFLFILLNMEMPKVEIQLHTRDPCEDDAKFETPEFFKKNLHIKDLKLAISSHFSFFLKFLLSSFSEIKTLTVDETFDPSIAEFPPDNFNIISDKIESLTIDLAFCAGNFSLLTPSKIPLLKRIKFIGESEELLSKCSPWVMHDLINNLFFDQSWEHLEEIESPLIPKVCYSSSTIEKLIQFGVQVYPSRKIIFEKEDDENFRREYQKVSQEKAKAVFDWICKYVTTSTDVANIISSYL